MQPSELSFTVHPSSGVPIYRQIMDQVLAAVLSGRARAGELLPSTRKLAETLEVNMMTVSKAYARLESDGVLTRVRGRGMIVAEQDGAVTLYVDEDWAAERGADVSKLVKVPIPRELYASGTVQQLREYAATYLESLGETNSSS